MTNYPVLSVTTFLPLAGALLVLVSSERLARWLALAATLLTLIVSAPLYLDFDKTSTALQFRESVPWIPSWNIVYGLGVDGISLPFLFLSSVMSVLCVSASWKAVQTRVSQFYAALLVSETAMIGLFASTNLFLFYIFWELMIVPMFLIIGVWGGSNRVFASVKFLLFTLAGSVLMLVGLIVLLYAAGTVDFQALTGVRLSAASQTWLFLAFLAAFAVKVPMFPVHTWLPDAHTEAPTAGSVILAGILLKMGAYGFLRISIPIFPDALKLFVTPMLVLSVAAIVYGAYVTLAQTDVKRLIAYSSVSHMGFVTLGIFSLNPSGLTGGILQMINHAVITGALFLCIGMIYERTHTRQIADYGGLFKAVPVYTLFFAFFCLAGIGFPGLNAFVGEFLIISGAFTKWAGLGVMAVWGVALGTLYIVWLYYRVSLGEVKPALRELLLDLDAREVATLLPLVVMALVIGLYPESVLGFVRAPVAHLLNALATSPIGVAGGL